MYRELKIDVMRLHAILVSRATHGNDHNEEEFQKLRDEITSQKDFRDSIPDFLYTCRTLDQFWNYVKKPKFLTYDERRQFLLNEFNPLLSMLEEKQLAKAQEKAFEYDVALSFAGEERPYVEKIAEFLKTHDVKVFYDEDEEEEAKMWGMDLTEYLYNVYSKRALYCVMFISNNYAEKIWTVHEKRSALERAIREKSAYILPARFDDTLIDGLPSTFKYIDLSKKRPEQLGKLVLMKLGKA